MLSLHKTQKMVLTLKQGASKKYIDELLNIIAMEIRSKGVNTKKYCGVIQLKEDALAIQKRLRS